MKRKQPIRPVPVPDHLGDYLDAKLFGPYFARKASLEKLLDACRAGVNPLYICAGPNSGKTVFAKELAWKLTKDPSSGKGKTYVLKFQGSIRESIARCHIPLYVLLPRDGWDAGDSGPEEQRYRDKLRLFRQYTPEKSVFILDGVRGMSLAELSREEAYNDLLSLGTVIITGEDTASFPEWVIEPLPEVYRTAGREPDSYTGEERIILKNASLLPPTGMGTTAFLRAQGEGQRDTVLKLIREGSLEEVPGQRILPGNFPATGCDGDCAPFLTALQRRAESPGTSQTVYEQICQTFKNAAVRLPDPDGMLARCAGRLFRERGDYAEAFPLYERFLMKQQSRVPQDPKMLGLALYEAGCIRIFRAESGGGDREALGREGKEMLMQALACQEAVCSRGSVDLTRTRLALARLGAEESGALAEFALSDPDKRMEWAQQALEIRETWAPRERYALYIGHLELAWLAGCRGNFRYQAEELSEAIEILLQMLPPDHPIITEHRRELEAAVKNAAAPAP